VAGKYDTGQEPPAVTIATVFQFNQDHR